MGPDADAEAVLSGSHAVAAAIAAIDRRPTPVASVELWLEYGTGAGDDGELAAIAGRCGGMRVVARSRGAVVGSADVAPAGFFVVAAVVVPEGASIDEVVQEP